MSNIIFRSECWFWTNREALNQNENFNFLDIDRVFIYDATFETDKMCKAGMHEPIGRGWSEISPGPGPSLQVDYTI